MRKLFHECHLHEVLSIIHFPQFYSGEKVFGYMIVDIVIKVETLFKLWMFIILLQLCTMIAALDHSSVAYFLLELGKLKIYCSV